MFSIFSTSPDNTRVIAFINSAKCGLKEATYFTFVGILSPNFSELPSVKVVVLLKQLLKVQDEVFQNNLVSVYCFCTVSAAVV